jgi:hypothetical protein
LEKVVTAELDLLEMLSQLQADLEENQSDFNEESDRRKRARID